MTSDSVCIATITWARTTEEEALLKDALTALANHNCKVFITDGGSTASFVAWLKAMPGFELLPAAGKGVQAQAVNSMIAAYGHGAPYVLYTEPDKRDFFAQHLLLSKLAMKENIGLLLFTRSLQAFASFPAFQQSTETAINNCCAEVTGEALDYTYGPFVLHRNVIPQLRHLKQDVGWGWRPYAFNMAKRMGFGFETMEGEYCCPWDQRNDDSKERLYRMKQLEQNIRGIVLSAEAELVDF